VTELLDLGAARDLRQLVDSLGSKVPHVEVVVAIHTAAVRAGNRRWVAWACREFDRAYAVTTAKLTQRD
jgi:hypothetical protein